MHSNSFLCQEYFEAHYSLVQRTAILTAIAMGARECAQLPTITTEPARAKVDFPSKYLPPKLHAKYGSPNDYNMATGGVLRSAMDAVAQEAFNSGADKTRPTGVVRKRQLQARSANRTNRITAMDDHLDNAAQPKFAYTDIAAEYFILPFINRFWTYFEEEMSRERRQKYMSGGTGMILSSLALSQYLSTLAVLAHAAQHSPAFLSIICPEAIELALMIGTKLPGSTDFTPASSANEQEAEFANDVVCAALDLVLVSVNGAKQLDGGRTLASDKPQLLFTAAEWAGNILRAEKQGQATTIGMGGSKEGRITKAAAGVLFTVTSVMQAMQARLNYT